MQAVWASFFANLPTVTRFDRPQALVAFLSRVASNKVVDECRRRLVSKKHNINRERSLDSAEIPRNAKIAKNVPTPSEVAISREQWRMLTEGKPTHYKRILEMRVTGASSIEIANELDINERTVRRIMQRLIRSLQDQQQPGPAAED